MSSFLAALWRRLWALLTGRPRLERLADGSVRVRLGGVVFEANNEDDLIGRIDRDRDRILRRLSAERQASGFEPVEFDRRPWGDPAMGRARALEQRLELYNRFLGELINTR